MINQLNITKPLTSFQPRRTLVSCAVSKALPLILISPLLLSSELSFAAQVTPNPNPVANTITVNSTDVSNEVTFDNLGIIQVNTSGSLTNNATLKNHHGGTLSLTGYGMHIQGKHNALTNVGTLENSGNINISSYQNFLVNQGVLNNEAGGLINLYNSNTNYNNNLRVHNAATGVLNNKAGASITLENSQSNKYFINDGVVNNDGTITVNSFSNFHNSGQFYNNAGASLMVDTAWNDNKVGSLINAGDAVISKRENTDKLAQTINNSGNLTLERLTLTRPLTNHNGGSLTTKGNGSRAVILGNDSPYSGNFYNSGTWRHLSGQTFKNEALVQNNSDGIINLSGYFNNAATFNNAGSLTLNSGSDLYGAGTFTQTSGSTTVNSQLAADAGVNINGGSLAGKGRILLAANTLQIAEQVAVTPGATSGAAIGTLSVQGDVAFNGELSIELAGKEQGNYDELAVTGDIALGAASSVLFDFNFAVAEEFTLDFVTAGSVTDFNQLNYSWQGLSAGYAVIINDLGTSLQLEVAIDTDGDKVADKVDLFPLDGAESADADGDGIGDNADLDDDNDGFSDIDELANDTSPINAGDKPLADNDGDFISDLTDTDDDNDGYSDVDELANGTSTFDAADKPFADSDGDFVSDLLDIDNDNDNLIEISSLADLDEIRNNLAGTSLFGSDAGCLSVCNGFELGNDLDFDTNANGVIDINDTYWQDGYGWQPLGNSSAAFSANFNGNGFTINNLYINRSTKSYQGLFGKVAGQGTELSKLNLSNVRIVGASATGALAGSVNGTSVHQISVTGSVQGLDYTGGIIGNSLNNDVVASRHIGSVSAQNKAGGIVGASSNTNFSLVYHIGSVIGDESAGGIVGSLIGNISDAYSAGYVSGNGNVGGIAGQVYDSGNSDSLARNYSVSRISTDAENNGQVGMLFGVIANENLALTSNYYLRNTAYQNTSYDAAGESVAVDTSIALTSEQLTCPQQSNDVNCLLASFSDWDDATPIWDFGNTAQYPALVINGNGYFLADFDQDGVSDLDDRFPSIALGALSDNDGDGAPDQCQASCLDTGMYADLDDDNDGVLDEFDSFPLNAAESLDSDGDGVGDNADTLPFDATETLDSDGDGIGNNADSDDDNDGILDELDGAPLDANIGDIEAPVFTHSDSIFMHSQGRLTDVANLIDIKAIDAVDGEITAKVVGETVFTSGQHSLELSATDNAGNVASYQAELNIKPEVSIIGSKTTEAGATTSLGVYLSGAAPHYPVQVLYNVYINGEVHDEAWVNISEGSQGEISLAIPADLSVTDTMSVSLEFASPAHIGAAKQTELVLIDTNVEPVMAVTVSQNGQQVSVIDPDNGVVTVQANISDINQADQHAINWQVQDNAFADMALDNNDTSFEIDATQLITGRYRLDISATETNTGEAYFVSNKLYLTVEQLTTLAFDLDSDNDGINDSEEGYGDSDGDGIANYLDNNSNTSELASSENTEPMQTVPGLTMSLGSLVQGATSKDASLSLDDLAAVVGADAASTESADFSATTPLYNFTIYGLTEQGASVAVVIPLEPGSVLPVDAVYRKYNTVTGWYNFVEDANNSIRSAKTDSNGNCPAPNDASYVQGLTVGDNCIQLIIEDGGANDADFSVNGSVEDPGAVMVASENSAENTSEESVPETPTPANPEPTNTAPEVTIVEHESSAEESTQMSLIAQGSDAEGDELTYSWQQLAGPEVSFADIDSTEVLVSLPNVDSDQVVVLQVKVSDGELNVSASTEITILANAETTLSTPTEQESTESSSSSGGSIGFFFSCLLLIFGYRRMSRANQEINE